MRKWLHSRFGVHHWDAYDNGGTVDKRKCRICGTVEWFDFIGLEWFNPEYNLKETPPTPRRG